MQQNLILEPEPWGLPLSEVLLPQHLSALGYTSHAVGKWHLGFFKKAYTPTARGFSTYFGFWNGYQDYYTHVVQASVSRNNLGQVGLQARHLCLLLTRNRNCSVNIVNLMSSCICPRQKDK